MIPAMGLFRPEDLDEMEIDGSAAFHKSHRSSEDPVIRRWAQILEKLNVDPVNQAGFARAVEGLANVAGTGMGRGAEVEFAKRVVPHLNKAYTEALAVGNAHGGPQPWGKEYVVDWRTHGGRDDGRGIDRVDKRARDPDSADEGWPPSAGFEPGLG